MTIIEKINSNFTTADAKKTDNEYSLNNECIFGYSIENSALCCGTVTIGCIAITTNVAIYDNNLLVELMTEMLDTELCSKSEVILTVQLGGVRHLYLSKALKENDKKFAFISNEWVNSNTGNTLLTYLITKKVKI